MNRFESHYDVLGVTPQTSFETIRGRYRELARSCHPDIAGAQGQKDFQRITSAYNILQDPQRRAQYDQALRGQRQSSAPVKAPARPPEAPAAVLRSSAMQRLLKEAEGDALFEAGEYAEALASYRDALGRVPNPALEAKIARLEAGTGVSRGDSRSPAPANHAPLVEENKPPFWQRWFGKD